MRENTYKTHQKILGAIFIAYSAINLIGGIALLATFNIVNIFVDEPEVIQVVAIFSRFIGSILLLTAIPGIIAGIGYLQTKKWSKNIGLIVGIVYLLFIPIGTVIGIYTIWLSSQTVIEEKQPRYATDLIKESKV
jgi:hypothetical protein